MSSQSKKIIITTGDSDGIGTEVTSKALNKIKPQKNIQFIIYRNNKCPKKYLKLIDKKFQRITFNSFNDYCIKNPTVSRNSIIDINSDQPPTEWVFEATRLGLKNNIDALVTAPLSKVESFNTHKVLGHTEVFRKLTQKKLFMYFIGKHFKTLLMTDHIPLKEVSSSINKRLITKVLSYAQELAKMDNNKKPIGLIGLNPHAGEEGLLGKEELRHYIPIIEKFNLNKGPKTKGPLVPDVAFCKQNWNKYSLFISPFHDQGLTAFKLVHGQNEGIQYTVGLPFVRTSVDHGTAKELFKKDLADCGSMEMALKYAIKYIQ